MNHLTWDKWSKDDLIIELKNRMDFQYLKTNGRYNFPSSYEGDLLRMVEVILSKDVKIVDEKYLSVFPLGCSTSGFCFNCKIIVGDSTCFCVGGPCPLCGNYVYPRTIPKDLNGIYEQHLRGFEITKQRFENGVCKGLADN